MTDQVDFDKQLLSEESGDDSPAVRSGNPFFTQAEANEKIDENSVRNSSEPKLLISPKPGNESTSDSTIAAVDELPTKDEQIVKEEANIEAVDSLVEKIPSGLQLTEIPDDGLFIQRTKVVKHFKRVTVTEEYYENGRLVFSTGPIVETLEIEPRFAPEVLIVKCEEECFRSAEEIHRKSIPAPVENLKKPVKLNSLLKRPIIPKAPSSVTSVKSEVSVSPQRSAQSSAKKTPASKKASKKGKGQKAQVIEAPDPSVIVEDRDKLYVSGRHSFYHGEPVFALWTDDGRWYAGRITGIRGCKFGVDWCENDQQNYITGENIVRAEDILKKGLKINFIVPGKEHYDHTTLEEYKSNGHHMCRGAKGGLKSRSFDKMMLHNADVQRFLKGLAPVASSSSAGNGSKKRARSTSSQPEHSKKAKPSARKSRKGAVEDVEKEESDEEKEDIAEEVPRGIFEHCTFLVTSGVNTDDLSFDRNHIQKLIEDNAGVHVDSFSALLKVHGKRFLVAPNACRTAKFFQCLAANIPCVSHKYIVVSVEAGPGKKIKIDDSYRLPAGKVGGSLVKWKPRDKMLASFRIGLVGGTTFEETWLDALKAAHAFPKMLEVSEYRNVGMFDVVITETQPSQVVYRSCVKEVVPLVSLEWLVQSLIAGKRQNFEEYAYEDHAAA